MDVWIGSVKDHSTKGSERGKGRKGKTGMAANKEV